MVVLSSSGSHSALEKHESHALQLSAARLGSYLVSAAALSCLRQALVPKNHHRILLRAVGGVVWASAEG